MPENDASSANLSLCCQAVSTWTPEKITSTADDKCADQCEQHRESQYLVSGTQSGSTVLMAINGIGTWL